MERTPYGGEGEHFRAPENVQEIPRKYEVTLNLDELEPEAQLELLAAITKPEHENTPQLDWPEGNPDGTIEEDDYNKRLDYRLGNVGNLLDASKAKIGSDEQVAE